MIARPPSRTHARPHTPACAREALADPISLGRVAAAHYLKTRPRSKISGRLLHRPARDSIRSNLQLSTTSQTCPGLIGTPEKISRSIAKKFRLALQHEIHNIGTG